MAWRLHRQVPLHLSLFGAVGGAPSDEHAKDDVPEVVVIVEVEFQTKMQSSFVNIFAVESSVNNLLKQF